MVIKGSPENERHKPQSSISAGGLNSVEQYLYCVSHIIFPFLLSVLCCFVLFLKDSLRVAGKL